MSYKIISTLEMVKVDNEKESKPSNQLIQAAKEGNLTTMEKLLKDGADPFDEDEGKRTILHHVCGLNNSDQSYECTKVVLDSIPLLENRERLVKKLDKLGRSPLYWAAIKGNTETISVLLQNSADIFVLDVGKESVLHAAARCGNHFAALESVRKICESAAITLDFLDQKSSADNNCRTCLHLAVLNGNDILVKYFIEKGASPQEVDESSYNSIHLAIQNREPQNAVNLCKILLGSDNDNFVNIPELIGQKDDWQRTPLHLSARQGNSEIIDLLIEKGADVMVKDKNSNTALHLAAGLGSEEKSVNSVNCLLQNNLDAIHQHKFVNVQNNKGQTALYIAAKNFNTKAAEKLLLSGSEYDIKTEKNKTPLEKVYRNVPSALTVLLDEAVKNSGYSVRNGVISNYAKIDFGPILGRSLANNPSKIYQETEELAKICHADIEKRQPVLSHTFVKIFIWKKWEKVGWCFYLSRIFHLMWYMFCLVYLLKVYRETCPFNSPKNDTLQFSLSAISPPEDSEEPRKVSLDQCDFSGFPFIGGFLIIIGSIIVLLGEVYPTYQRYQWYYRPIKNFTIGSAPKKILQIVKFTYDVLPLTQIIVFLLVCLTSPPLFGIYPLNDLYHFALVAAFAFTTCVCMYLELGKFPGFRVYVNLLLKISSSLFCAILVHFPILVGFAAVFVFLLQGMPSFSSLPQAIVKVLTLSIGELDYQSVIYDGLLLFKGIEMLAFGVFVIFITVVLINFLVGLATDDVKESRERRKVAWKLCTQIEQIFLLESFLDVCGLWIGKYILENHILLMPPIEKGQVRRTAELYIPSLPKDLQKELHNLNLKILPDE